MRGNNDRIVTFTNGTYPWSSVTHITLDSVASLLAEKTLLLRSWQVSQALKYCVNFDHVQLLVPFVLHINWKLTMGKLKYFFLINFLLNLHSLSIKAKVKVWSMPSCICGIHYFKFKRNADCLFSVHKA